MAVLIFRQDCKAISKCKIVGSLYTVFDPPLYIWFKTDILQTLLHLFKSAVYRFSCPRPFLNSFILSSCLNVANHIQCLSSFPLTLHTEEKLLILQDCIQKYSGSITTLSTHFFLFTIFHTHISNIPVLSPFLFTLNTYHFTPLFPISAVILLQNKLFFKLTVL